MSKKNLILFNFLLIIISFLNTAIAYASPPPFRLSASAYMGDLSGSQADIMLPIAGNTYHNLYLNPTIAYACNDQGYADLGLGYRWVKNQGAILGGYLFANYTRINNNAHLWVLNPGIEALGSRWDAHLNTYFPIGNKQYSGTNASFTNFAGHSEFLNLFRINQNAGNGADVLLSYQFFPKSSLKGYVGSYFFSPSQTANIWGGITRLEYWFNSSFKIFANYSYDNIQQSSAALGLGLELGGTHIHRSDPPLTERITDPVEHYLAQQGRGSSIPTRKSYQHLASQLYRNNIAFFSQTGGPNNGGLDLTITNCTFENPCGPIDLSDQSVTKLNALLPNTVIYFNGGNYSALNVPGGAAGVTLQPGQTIESRTSDYKQVATGEARSTFAGAFVLTSNNKLSNIILLPTPDTKSGEGILLDSGANNSITGSQIGSSTNPFNIGVEFNASQGIINQSIIFAGEETAQGIKAENSSNITILNSEINVKGSGQTDGIFLSSNSRANVNNIKMQVIGTESNSIIAGPRARDNASINITNSEITTTGPGYMYGILSLADSTVNADNLKIEVTNTGNNNAYILRTGTGGSITMKNGVLIATAPSEDAAITRGLNVTVAESTCTVNGTKVICS